MKNEGIVNIDGIKVNTKISYGEIQQYIIHAF